MQLKGYFKLALNSSDTTKVPIDLTVTNPTIANDSTELSTMMQVG